MSEASESSEIGFFLWKRDFFYYLTLPESASVGMVSTLLNRSGVGRYICGESLRANPVD